jgi:hypothetical protein
MFLVFKRSTNNNRANNFKRGGLFDFPYPRKSYQKVEALAIALGRNRGHVNRLVNTAAFVFSFPFFSSLVVPGLFGPTTVFM